MQTVTKMMLQSDYTCPMTLPKLGQAFARFLFIDVLLSRVSEQHLACACDLESFGCCLQVKMDRDQQQAEQSAVTLTDHVLQTSSCPLQYLASFQLFPLA